MYDKNINWSRCMLVNWCQPIAKYFVNFLIDWLIDSFMLGNWFFYHLEVLTLQQFLSLKVVSHSHLIVFDNNYESKIKRQLIFYPLSAQQPILTEIIIYWKCLIEANLGVKDFAQTRNWSPVSQFSVRFFKC